MTGASGDMPDQHVTPRAGPGGEEGGWGKDGGGGGGEAERHRIRELERRIKKYNT